MLSIEHYLLPLFIGTCIVWRLAAMIVYEPGPFDVFQRFRDVIGVRSKQTTHINYETGTSWLQNECDGKNVVAKMVCCFHCTSFWVSIPVSLYLFQSEPLAFILVLNTLAIIMDRGINGKS